MISDHPIIKKIAWTSGTRRAGASMETHREYVGYLDEWDGAERLTDEEIVRCRDCKYRHTVRSWLGMDVEECWLHADHESGALGKEPTEPNGFCSWGERRDV